MPEIKLTVADLAYMTGLMSNEQRCQGSQKVRDRLIFLGLIEMADISPCPKQVANWEKRDNENWQKIVDAVKAENRDAVYRFTNDWHFKRKNPPQKYRDYRLTKSGLEFIAKGRATSITSAEAGCVK